MNAKLLLVAAIALSTSAVACADLTPDYERYGEPETNVGSLSDPFADYDFTALYDGQLPVAAASLIGDIGPVYGLNGTANEIYGYGDADWTSVSMTVVGDSGAGMAMVDIYGDLSALAGIGPVEFNGYEYYEGDISVSIVGCSGPENGWWDFDQSAEDVVITVEEHPENPDVMVVAFTASFIEYTYVDYYDEYYYEGEGEEYYEYGCVPGEMVAGDSTTVDGEFAVYVGAM